MRRLVLVVLSMIAVWDLSGCATVNNSSAGTGAPPSLQPISVTLTGTMTSIDAAAASVTIGATVNNDPTAHGVKWFLQVQTPTGNPINCAPTCGTLSMQAPFSVTYTPPPTVPGTLILPGTTQPTNFASPMITAIAVADNRQNASDPFNIQGTPDQVLGVQISNPFTTIGTGGNGITLGVTLTNDVNNLGVSWTLTFNNAPCGGNLTNISQICGSLINITPFSAVYIAPEFPIGPSAHPPTITATANSDITKSATNPLTVFKSTTPNALMGQFAFRLNGFDSNGKPIAIAGSFTADGSGNINNGAMDVNDDQVLSTIPSFLNGFYYIDQNMRGNIGLTTLLGSGTLSPPTFAYTLSADGTRGTIIGFDTNSANNLLISGTFEKQDATAFSLQGINNDYVFKLESNLPDRYDAVGKISIDLDFKVNVFIDTSRIGIGPSLVDAEFLGALLKVPDSNGRGTINLGPFNFVYYVVSSNSLYLVQSDPGTVTNALWSGVVKFQSIQSFTPATVNATSVFNLTGLDTIRTVNKPIVSAGTLAISNQTSANLLWDSNDGGDILSQLNATGQAVTFSDPTLRTGRGTITVTNGHANGLADSFVFYLADSGDGFLLDTTAGADNRAMVGDLLLQTGGGAFSDSTLSANMLVTSGGSASLKIPNVAGSTTPSNENFTGLVDLSFPKSAAIPLTATLAPNQDFAGTYMVLDANSGRATAVVPGALLGQLDPVSAVFYLVGPNQFFLIGTQPGLISGVSSFAPR
jgi:hypothetical protein